MASLLPFGSYAHGTHRSLSNQPFPKQSQLPTFMAQCGMVQIQGWGGGWGASTEQLGGFLGKACWSKPGRKDEWV